MSNLYSPPGVLYVEKMQWCFMRLSGNTERRHVADAFDDSKATYNH